MPFAPRPTCPSFRPFTPDGSAVAIYAPASVVPRASTSSVLSRSAARALVFGMPSLSRLAASGPAACDDEQRESPRRSRGLTRHVQIVRGPNNQPARNAGVHRTGVRPASHGPSPPSRRWRRQVSIREAERKRTAQTPTGGTAGSGLSLLVPLPTGARGIAGTGERCACTVPTGVAVSQAQAWCPAPRRVRPRRVAGAVAWRRPVAWSPQLLPLQVIRARTGVLGGTTGSAVRTGRSTIRRLARG